MAERLQSAGPRTRQGRYTLRWQVRASDTGGSQEYQSIGDQSSDRCAPIELRVKIVERNVGPRRPQRFLVLLLARDALLRRLVVRPAAILTPRDPLLLLTLLALQLARLVPRLALARGGPRVRPRLAPWRGAPPPKLIKGFPGRRTPPSPAPRRRPAPSIAVVRAASPARRAAPTGRTVTPRRAIPPRRRAAPATVATSVAHAFRGTAPRGITHEPKAWRLHVQEEGARPLGAPPLAPCLVAVQATGSRRTPFSGSRRGG